MKAAALVTLAAAGCAHAFAPHTTLPAVPTGAAMMMRSGGSSKGGSFGGARFSLRSIFTASPVKRGGGNSNGGGGGMIGGGNNSGGINRSSDSFEEDDSLDGLAAMAALGVLGDLWDSYNQVLDTNPVLTKACTSLVGFSIGDTLAQKFVSNSPFFDYQRLARMAAFGFLFHGTISHFFYNKLDEVIPGKTPLAIVQKVFTDQVLWAPIFTFVYLTWMGVTSGLNPSQVGEKIRTDLVKGVVGSWSVWPLVHAIGFKYVPLEQRLLYINCIQIGYNIFLSVLGSNSGGKPASPAPAINLRKR